MSQVLVIRSSANGAASVSNQLIDAYLAALKPGASVVDHDLDHDPVPYLTAATLAGIGRPAPESDASQATRVLSDRLVAELLAADTLVLGVPMYNFGMPATLKSWFDHILRAGVTFRYTAAGPEGLVTNTRAIIVAARAGAYSGSESVALEHQISHVRTLLGFMGISDVTVVLAEGLAFGEEAATAAIGAAREAVEKLAKASA